MPPKLSERAKKITRLCKEAREKYMPEPDGTTYCNLAVNYIAKGLSYDDLSGMLANKMIQFIETSADWAEVKPEDAKRLADDGNLVVAGRRNKPHGHVAVVYPGAALVPSGKWGGKWPAVNNVGKTNWICGSSYAFTYKPKYYVLIQDREEDA